MEYSTKREKKVLLTNYKNKVDEIKTMVYDAIKTAAELQRPHDEMERLVALSKAYDHGWYRLNQELEELNKKE